MIYKGQTFVLEARGRHGLPPLGAYKWAPPATPVTSGVGKKEKGHCNQAPHITALTPLGTHLPCRCHCPMLWAVPRLLITVPYQDPTTRSSWCSTSCMGKARQGASCMVCRWRVQAISDSRGGCGPLPPGISEKNHLQPQPPQRAPQRRTL